MGLQKIINVVCHRIHTLILIHQFIIADHYVWDNSRPEKRGGDSRMPPDYHRPDKRGGDSKMPPDDRRPDKRGGDSKMTPDDRRPDKRGGDSKIPPDDRRPDKRGGDSRLPPRTTRVARSEIGIGRIADIPTTSTQAQTSAQKSPNKTVSRRSHVRVRKDTKQYVANLKLRRSLIQAENDFELYAEGFDSKDIYGTPAFIWLSANAE